MQRKYIYIIVVCLTVVLVTATQYFDSNKRKTDSDHVHYLEEDYDNSLNNVEILSQLELKNVQNDDKHIPYTYKLVIEGIAGAYKYSYNDQEKYLVFDAKGEAQILLNSNESIILYDLPNDASYTIEQTNNVKESYTTTANEENSTIVTGKISLTNKVVFENRTIIKPIEDESEEEKKNPVTVDNIPKFIILSIFLIVITYILSKIKIQRFE